MKIRLIGLLTLAFLFLLAAISISLPQVSLAQSGCRDAAGRPIPCPPTSRPQQPRAATPVPPADRDGDGVSDGSDQCPDQPGVSESAGCPATEVPTALPTQMPLPSTGPCVLTTQGWVGVNIRELPSLDSVIVGGLNPVVLYDVISQQETADGVWRQVDGGWVAGRVTRLGGDCSAKNPVPLGGEVNLCLDKNGDGITIVVLVILGAPNKGTAWPYPLNLNPVDIIVEDLDYVGTDCPEHIYGTVGKNTINGMGGDDVIWSWSNSDHADLLMGARATTKFTETSAPIY